jgi:hypothetical protein
MSDQPRVRSVILGGVRVVGALAILGMLVAWASYGVSSIPTITFGFTAGAMGVDQYAFRGILMLKNRNKEWRSQYLPSLILMHVGIPLVAISFLYENVITAFVGVLFLSIGGILSLNQYQRSISLIRREMRTGGPPSAS